MKQIHRLLLTVLILSACATSPLGRKRILLFGDSTMDSMGVQSFDEIKKKTPIEADPKINAYVKCIARPLIANSGSRIPVSGWEVVVFRDPTPNAFALPGGKIGVHTGMLPVARTADQLAAVIGHEVGHVLAQHGNERVSHGELASLLMGVVDVSLREMDPDKKKLLLGGLGVGLQFGALLPFSRSQESESDLIGLRLMVRSGFDPKQSVELWKNMKASAGGAGPEWLSTHPSPDSRIRTLEAEAVRMEAEWNAVRERGNLPQCSRS
jgi:predicted Zn-dependent protease